MIPMMTKEEFEKVVEICTSADMNCGQCPLSKKIYRCGGYLARYIKENEPALSANSTSSEILKNINSTHLDDSTLLDICQEELKAITVIALNDYPNGYLTGYIVALKKNIERLRGDDNNG